VERPRGTRRIYTLHDQGILAVRAYLERVWGDAVERFRAVATVSDEAGTASRTGELPRDR